jgi:hypothetical protein
MFSQLYADLWMLVGMLLFLGGPFLCIWLVLVIRRASRDLKRIADALDGGTVPSYGRRITHRRQEEPDALAGERHVAYSMFGR